MKRVVSRTIVAMTVFALIFVLAHAGCDGEWETLTSGGIAIESVDRDANGYIVEEAAKDAALDMAEVYDESLCLYMETQLDRTADPVCWVVDFSADGTQYHYVVNAENGDLITFESWGL